MACLKAGAGVGVGMGVAVKSRSRRGRLKAGVHISDRVARNLKHERRMLCF